MPPDFSKTMVGRPQAMAQRRLRNGSSRGQDEEVGGGVAGRGVRHLVRQEEVILEADGAERSW
jgi:hypothetical protein